MTVRNLALQLYHWMKRLEELEQEHAALGSGAPLEEHNRLDNELTEARRQVEHYHKLLEAQKEETKI